MIGSINLTKNALENFCSKYNYEMPHSANPDKEFIFTAIEPINIAKKNHISFCRFDDEKGLQLIFESEAGCLLVPQSLKSHLTKKQDSNLIYCDHPRLGILHLINEFWKEPVTQSYVEKKDNIFIDPSSQVADGVKIGPCSIIGPGCKIGKGTVIGSGTSISYASIGKFCSIGSNVTIGGEGYGYEIISDSDSLSFPHIGDIRIANNVRIGSSTCIDRASIGSTVISDNVKIDNLVHIAHNVSIGRNSNIVALSIIGGSVNIGSNVWIAPGSSVRDWVNIGDKSIIGLGAVVTKNVDENVAVIGNPAREIDKTKKRYR
jgi:UDP-3-O-[3-hydroxymyristoyl] glucosamine N-acyltransferase